MAELSYYLDMRSRSSDGRGALKILISHRNTTSLWTLGIRLLPTEWNADKSQIVLHPDKATLNLTRKQMMDRANIVVMTLSNEGKLGKMNAKNIKDAIASFYVGTPVGSTSSFFSGFDDKMSEVADRTREIYYETYKKVLHYVTNNEYYISDKDLDVKFRNSTIKEKKQVREELLQKARSDFRSDTLSFEDINEAWLKRFDAWMTANTPAKNARAIHMRNIRAVFNLAIDNEKTTSYPFRKFKIKKEETEKRSLTVQELRDIFTGDFDPECQEAVNIFRLTFCLIGINFKDLFMLKRENINSRGYVNYRRAKTGRLYQIKLEPEARQLCDSMAGQEWLINQHDRFKSHKDALQKINIRLKQLGPVTYENFDQRAYHPTKIYHPLFPELSTYWARHSWATAAAQLDVPKETISAALGHSMGSRTTAVYIDYDARKVDVANRLVLDWVFYGKYTSWNQAMLNLQKEMEQEKVSGKDQISLIS